MFRYQSCIFPANKIFFLSACCYFYYRISDRVSDIRYFFVFIKRHYRLDQPCVTFINIKPVAFPAFVKGAFIRIGAFAERIAVGFHKAAKFAVVFRKRHYFFKFAVIKNKANALYKIKGFHKPFELLGIKICHIIRSLRTNLLFSE